MSPFHTKFRYAHKNTNMCWEFYWKLSSWNFITEVFFPPFLFCLFKLEVSCKTNVCALKPAVCVGLIQWLTHSRILRSAELHWNKGYAFRLSLESSVRIGTGAQYFEKKKKTHKMKNLNSFDFYCRDTSDKTNLCQVFYKVLSSSFPYCWASQLSALSPSVPHSSFPSLLHSFSMWTFTCFCPYVFTVKCITSVEGNEHEP